MRPDEDDPHNRDTDDFASISDQNSSIDLNEIEGLHDRGKRRQDTFFSDEESADDDPPEEPLKDISKPPKRPISKLKIILFTILISSMIMSAIFILNGIAVGGGFYGMYQAATAGKGGLVIDELVIEGLETMDANVSLQATINGGFLSKFASFELTGPTSIQVILPNFSSPHLEDTNPVILTVEIPTFSCERGEKVIKIAGMKVSLNSDVPLNDLILWYSNLGPDGHLLVKSNIKFSTWSFLVPLVYEHKLNMKIPLTQTGPEKSDSGVQELAKLESFEFLNDPDEEMRLRCFIALRIAGSVIPAAVKAKIPQFQFKLEYFEDPEFPLEMMKITTLADEFEGGQEKLFRALLEVTGGNHLARVLERLRDKDTKFDLAISGTRPKGEASKLQKWLSTFYFKIPVDDMINATNKRIIMPQGTDMLVVVGEDAGTAKAPSTVVATNSDDSSTSSSSLIGNLFSEPPDQGLDHVSIGFEAVEGDRDLPKFVLRISVSKNFVWHMSGINFTCLKGKLPTIQLKNILERKASSDEPRLSEMIAIDIDHQESTTEVLEARFTLSLCNVKDITQVYSKLMRIKQSAEITMRPELAQLDSIFVTGSNKNLLSSLLRVFEVEMKLSSGTIGLKNSSSWKATLEETKEALAAITPPPSRGAINWDINEDDVYHMHHEAKVELKSEQNGFSLLCDLVLSKRPSIDINPHVRFYWTDIGFSILPSATIRNGSLQEMARFKLDSGQFHAKIAKLQPGLLLYDGGMNLSVRLKDNSSASSKSDGRDLELIRIWREMFELWYDGDDSVEYEIIFEVGNKKLQFDSYRTNRKSFTIDLDSSAEITSWTERLIATHVSLAGIRDSNINFLVELPKLSALQLPRAPKVSLTLTAKIPSFGVNICTNKETVLKKKAPFQLEPVVDDDDAKCFFKLGFSKPTTFQVSYLNGQICDITAMFEENRKHEIKLKHEFEDTGVSNTTGVKDDGNVLLLNSYLPMFISIIDLDTALAIMPDLWSSKMNDYRIFFGYPKNESYHDASIPMIERFLNGFVRKFEWFLPRVSEKKVVESRNVVEKTDKNSHLITEVEVKSASRSSAKIDITIDFPKELFMDENSFSDVRLEESESVSSLAKMMTLQWGDTDLTFKRGRSLVKISVAQGQISLSKLGSSMADINDKINVTIEFRFDEKEFSSRNLQNLKNIFVTAFNHRNAHLYPDYLIQLAKRLQQMSFELELNSRQYLKDTTRSSRRRAKKTDIDDVMIKKVFTGGFVINVMHYIYGFLQREVDSNAKPWEYAFVLKPFPFKDKPIVEVPYLFDHNCPNHGKLMMTPSDDRLCQFELRVEQLTFHLFKMMADTFAFGLKNIGMKKHPGKLKILTKAPKMTMFGQVNGIDLVEAELDPFSIKRTLNLVYFEEDVKPSEDEKAARNDVQLFTGRAYWGAHMKDFADIISPAYLLLESGVSPMLKQHPDCQGYILQNSPITMTFSNEKCPETNLISSLFCAWYGEHPISPMMREFAEASQDKDKEKEVSIKSVDLEEIVAVATNIRIPWPVPKIHIQIDDPITIEFVFRGKIFLRVFIETGLYISEPEFIVKEARVVVSKTGFGVLPIDRYSQDFADFMSGLVLGRSVQFTVVVHVGKRLSVTIPIYVPTKPATLSFFDSGNSDVILPRIDKITNLAGYLGYLKSVAAPAAAVYNYVTTYKPTFKLHRGDNDEEIRSEESGEIRLFKRSFNEDDQEDQNQQKKDTPQKQGGGWLDTLWAPVSYVQSYWTGTGKQPKQNEQSGVEEDGDSAGSGDNNLETEDLVRKRQELSEGVRPEKYRKEQLESLLSLREKYPPSNSSSSPSSSSSSDVPPSQKASDEFTRSHISASGDRIFDEPASETSPATKFLAHQLKIFDSIEEFRSGEKVWRSTFKPADLLSTTKLEDMVWIGAGKKRTEDLFQGNPPFKESTLNEVQFALSFHNSQEKVHLALGGQILHLFFHDHDGYTGFPVPHLPITPEQEIYARINVLPDVCKWPAGTGTPNILSILRCLHLNSANPAVDTPPGRHLVGDKRPKYAVEMTFSSLLQLGDEQKWHDGICYDVRQSNVVVEVVSNYDSNKVFIIDLILDMPNTPDQPADDKFGDPCGLLFKCVPDNQYVLWGGRQSKNFLHDPNVSPGPLTGGHNHYIDANVRHLDLVFDPEGPSPLRVKIDINDNQIIYQIKDGDLIHRDIYSWRRCKSLTVNRPQIIVNSGKHEFIFLEGSLKEIFRLTDPRIKSGAGSKTYRALEASAFVFPEPVRGPKRVDFSKSLNGVYWEAEPVDLRYGCSIDLNLACSKSTFTAEDCFGICWKVVRNADELGRFFDNGRAVCLKVYPQTRIIKFWDGVTEKDIITKPRAAVNPSFFPSDSRHLKILYTPQATKNKVIFMADPTKIGKRYSSSYPVNLDDYLRPVPGEQVHIGFFVDFLPYPKDLTPKTLTFDLKFKYVLPNLWSSLVYFTSLESPLPKEKYSIMIKLKNFCGELMSKSPAGLDVELWPISDEHDDPNDPSSIGFKWKELDTGYARPKSIRPQATKLDSSDLSKSPRRFAVPGTVRYVNQGYYEVVFDITWPGRYRILMAHHHQDPDRMTRIPPRTLAEKDEKMWIPAKNSHVYVHNYYHIAKKQ